MRFSRRSFVVGAAALSTGVVSAGVHLARQPKPVTEPLEEPEPAVVAPPLEESLLANRLVGIWDFQITSGANVFAELPFGPAELLLDVGPGGRALRGRLRDGDARHRDQNDGLRLYGELAFEKLPHLRWKLAGAGGAAFDCVCLLDEIWGEWATGRGEETISGTLRRLGVQAGYSGDQVTFLAKKRLFIEAHQRLHFKPEIQEWLISPGHRFFHQLWHATRDKWHELSESRREDLRFLGWQPGKPFHERAARGAKRHRNGSGEDFLFMHRWMLGRVRAVQDFPSWKNFPPPRPYIEHGIDAFVNYVTNIDGLSVPPAWQAAGDTEFNQWLHNIKSSEGYFGNIQLWEAQFQDPEYLSTLCLGELGSRIELGLHDWLHMRWASVSRDPNSGMALAYDRNPIDHAERWFGSGHDYLGDPFSSHLNPVFWLFHGWIDDRIEDWFLAHEQAHPGEITRQLINGVLWFAPGPWVRVAEPWLGPAQAGCGAWGRSNGGGTDTLDIETMKLALQIVFSEEVEAQRLGVRIPRRPWYARHLTPGPLRRT